MCVELNMGLSLLQICVEYPLVCMKGAAYPVLEARSIIIRQELRFLRRKIVYRSSIIRMRSLVYCHARELASVQ